MTKNIKALSAPALITAWVLAFSGAALAAGHGKMEDMKDRADKHFEMMDADGDGKVTREEAKAHHEARRAEADTNGDGKISKDEFKTAAQKKHDKRVERMFSHMDQNGDGFLTEEDRKGRESRGEKMFNHLDKDGDGAISKDEIGAMKGHHKGHHGGMH